MDPYLSGSKISKMGSNPPKLRNSTAFWPTKSFKTKNTIVKYSEVIFII